MIQQAIAQELTPIYEEQFLDNSYGFRPGRSAHDALAKCREYVEKGYVYTISMDLQAYFDTVNYSKLIEVLSRTIKDRRVISLIYKYLNAGIMEDGGFHITPEGIPFITKKLYLKINLEKTMVSHINKVRYLGYSFYRNKGKCRIRVHPKSVEKMKKRLREMTVRGNKWSNPKKEEKLRRYTTGWVKSPLSDKGL